jgi:hypothetical protein
MVQGEASGEDEKDRFRLCSSCSRSLPRVITLRTLCTFDHVWYPMRLEQRNFIPCVLSVVRVALPVLLGVHLRPPDLIFIIYLCQPAP